MDKIAGKWQAFTRLIIIFVSVGLLITGAFQVGKYFRDSEELKTLETAVIIEDPEDSGEQLFKYEFNGEFFTSDPIDEYTETFGDLGDTQQIYIQNSDPDRIFMTEKAKGELVLGGLLLGWGLLLALIVLTENRLLSILKKGKTEYTDE